MTRLHRHGCAVVQVGLSRHSDPNQKAMFGSFFASSLPPIPSQPVQVICSEMLLFSGSSGVSCILAGAEHTSGTVSIAFIIHIPQILFEKEGGGEEGEPPD